MTDSVTARLVIAAMLMGLMASWLLGAWLHIRLVRRTRAAARRVVRLVLPMDVAGTISTLVQGLTRSPHFFAHVRGYMEGVLTATIRPDTGGKPACNMACRMDDLGKDCRIRLRLDFTPMIDSTRTLSSVIMIIVWPAWIAITVLWVLGLSLASKIPVSPWFALNLIHGAWPMVAVVVALHARFRKRRKMLGDAVVLVVDNLRFLPRM